ncbi:hypothetical protein LENED_005178 [Lentinula edodes]|uniref:Uncharacterized protein n=1 Tax=Lentinula edodes TaxID=5353 RepID=A0A1Q3E895_LENED|nr:hypothetical protein LENED_005178 [Lentinula edodes]
MFLLRWQGWTARTSQVFCSEPSRLERVPECRHPPLVDVFTCGSRGQSLFASFVTRSGQCLRQHVRKFCVSR